MSSIMSKPITSTLKADRNGRCHLLVGHGDGGQVLVRLLKQMPAGADIRVLFASESSANKDEIEQFSPFDLTDLQNYPTQTAMLTDLDDRLSQSTMGTRLYIAGSGSFIGCVEQIAMKYNLRDDEMQCERCGSAARRVYCIHCRETNEDVTTNIVQCSGCNRHLFVRDHYSRRLAAYMGFMVDAETPGEMPPIKEVYT